MNKSDQKLTKPNPLFAWQESKPGLVVIVLFDLLIAYIFASLAIDTGSLLDYFITLLFLALAAAHAVKLVKKLRRHES